ncbi:hypothetical protein DFH09DRAFT_1329910 [Mycena vulgaris]|nr:hypothetical protein DFH09DRAFT_1329910 [Mycena vulgaris]
MLTNTSKYSAADQGFIDGLSTLHIYQPTYIIANAKIFINHDWIDINALRRFIIDKYEIPSPNKFILSNPGVAHLLNFLF